MCQYCGRFIKTLQKTAHSRLNHFLVIGSNFTKADTRIRSLFAITETSRSEVYEKVRKNGVKEFFVLSTCNRTEFYACTSEELLRQIISEQLNLRPGEFETYFYVKSGYEAIRHLLRVAAGLDSQIIGDYEIVGQLKIAVKSAREQLGAFVEFYNYQRPHQSLKYNTPADIYFGIKQLKNKTKLN